MYLSLLSVAIADEAERCAGELLVPDNGCHYDQLVEINLDEVSVGGPPINWGLSLGLTMNCYKVF